MRREDRRLHPLPGVVRLDAPAAPPHQRRAVARASSCAASRRATPPRSRTARSMTRPTAAGRAWCIRADVIAASLEAVYGEPAAGGARAPARDRADPPRAPVHRRRRRRAGRRARDRAALRPLRGLRRAGPRPFSPTTPSASAPSCWPAARSRPWPSSTPSPASCPGRSATRESLAAESFSEGLGGGLEHPHYTRPAVFLGHEVPRVLLSGDHGAIARWRAERVLPPRVA